MAVPTDRVEPALFLDDDERLLQQTLRTYALDRLLPDVARWKAEPFPRERMRELAELGVMGMCLPTEYGGGGATLRMLGIAAEELSRGDFNISYFLQLQTIGARLVLASGDEVLCREYIPAIAAGERLMSFALTEPGVGSDAAQLTGSARRDGGDWIVRGEKASISFAGNADACVVFARTGGAGAAGISMLLVPLDAPGVTRQVYSSAGSHLTQRGSLFFDDVRIPARHQLGAEGAGFVAAMGAFDFNRAIIALACVGAAQQSVEETMRYATERHTFGKPLARHEGVAFQLAEHLSLLHAARLVAYQVLELADAGRPHTVQAAMAKWLGPKYGVEAIHACMLLHGWSGYGLDLPYAQRLADVMGLEIGDGTPEIMKAIIARDTIGREFAAYR